MIYKLETYRMTNHSTYETSFSISGVPSPKEPHKLSTETEFVMYFEPHILCPTLNFITETREKNKMNFQDASLAHGSVLVHNVE